MKPATVWNSSDSGSGHLVGLAQLRRRDRAFDDQRAVAQPLDGPLLPVVLVLDLAHDLLEQVLEGDEAGDRAVLVDHEGHVGAPLLQLLQQRAHLLRLGHEVDGVQDLAGSRTGCRFSSRRSASLT